MNYVEKLRFDVRELVMLKSRDFMSCVKGLWFRLLGGVGEVFSGIEYKVKVFGFYVFFVFFKYWIWRLGTIFWRRVSFR